MPDNLSKLAEARRRINEQRRTLRAAERAAGISAADVHRQNMAERSRDASRARAEIGPPPPRDQELYDRYQFDLWLFLTECFPLSLGLSPLSDDHRQIIVRLQQTILNGGQDLTIAFRGAAKSTIIECAAIWATGYGHRRFFVPLGSTKELTQAALDSIQYEFETNDQLMKIFPEVCHAVQALEGIPQRANKQTINGEPTRIEWSRQRCILPTVAGFAGSGAIIWPRSIMSKGLRGTRVKMPDGTQARPDFCAPDDLQTDDSAKHAGQTKKRLDILRRVVLRLAGHRKRLAINVLGSILECDDLIDQLSTDKAWRVMRVPMLKSMPTHLDEWLGKYAEIRTTYDPNDDRDKARAEREANEYYAANRERLDAVAVATWESCFDPDCELSAVQHAMNIIVDSGMEAFEAECQCKPTRPVSSIELLSPKDIIHKQSAYSTGIVPPECGTLTAFVDVHPGILYFRVWAWQSLFNGFQIDSGTFPDQGRSYFIHKQLTRRLKHLFPNMSEEAVIVAALDTLLHGNDRLGIEGLMRRQWMRVDGTPFRIRCLLADANGRHRDLIVRVLSDSPFSGSMHPSYGKGVGAKDARISSYREAKKQQCGPEWMYTTGKRGEVPGILYDTNFWKSQFHKGLAQPAGKQGALLLSKANPADHRMAADHYVSETPKDVTVDGYTKTEYKLKPNADNHILDCDVGCMVAASRCGITNIAPNSHATRRPVRRKPRRTHYVNF